MRVDSHQHFWRYNPRDYSWIDERMAVLRRDFLPADLKRELNSAKLDGCVAVQARQSVEESEWLLQVADQFPFIKGVVGWVDLRSSQAGEQIERLSGHRRFAGVRHVLQDEPDDRFILEPAFLRGLERLAARGLTYDLLVYPRQLPAVIEVVKRFPDQRFVLDHLAKPPVKLGLISPWREQIEQLAGHQNVFCKVSGLVTEAEWNSWRASDFLPYLDGAFKAFGPERMMFGSDWPVCLLAGGYAQIVKLVEDYVSGLSPRAKAGIFGETAKKVYGLKD